MVWRSDGINTERRGGLVWSRLLAEETEAGERKPQLYGLSAVTCRYNECACV